MPKGIRKTTSVRSPDNADALTRRDEMLVPVGATHYPCVAEQPVEEIPPGVAVRSRRGVQIEYSLGGRRRTQTIKGAPTVRAVRAAAALRQRLIAAAGLGASEAAVELMIAEAIAAIEGARAPAQDRPEKARRAACAATRAPQANVEPTVGEPKFDTSGSL